MVGGLLSRRLGTLPGGEAVEALTLRGGGGVELELITWGAAVTRLSAPDRHGGRADLVLGYAGLDGYLADRASMGAMVGRTAGRITDGRFVLDGVPYQLPRNEGRNHLHGGAGGLHRRNWSARPSHRPDGAPSVTLSCGSADGEEGYPGNLSVDVTFTVTPSDVLLIETRAETDRPTLLSLAHHSYFNLAGEGAGSTADHWVRMEADSYVPMAADCTLSGRLAPVDGRANDLRRARRLGEIIPQLFLGHGDLYRVRRPAGDAAGLVHAARLAHPPSGRLLDVFTTSSYIQLYTGVNLDGTATGRSGTPYRAHAGVCLECHGYPGGTEAAAMGSIVLFPDHPRQETTAYAFRTAPDDPVSAPVTPP